MKVIHDSLVKILATGFGLGYVPRMPGTMGSLLGVLIYLLLKDNPFSVYVAAGGVTLLGHYLANQAERILAEKDSPKIVVDEVAGQLIAYSFMTYSLTNLVLGFAVFRLFDIIKPFPARWSQDNLPGGIGVMGDDIVAGIQTAIVLAVANAYF